MKIYAINGSPRKNKNTAQFLKAALDGAKNVAGIEPLETEMIHLYDLEYKSCMSCFECKRLGGRSYGKCALKDSLTPVMEKLAHADGLILGSPVYYGGITGKMKSFLERFLFQYGVYDMEYSSIAPRKMPTAFVYTMNVPESVMAEMEYAKNFKDIEFFIGRIFSSPKVLYATDTYQFDDYSKYKMECFSEQAKAEHRDKQFPVDLQSAFNIGASLLQNKGICSSQV